MNNHVQSLILSASIICLTLGACCGISGEPPVREDTTATIDPKNLEYPTPTFVFLPGMENPVEQFVQRYPIVINWLESVAEFDHGFEFSVHVFNPTLTRLFDVNAWIELYDPTGALLMKGESDWDRPTECSDADTPAPCENGCLESFSRCWTHISIEKSPITETATAYNVFVEASTPQGRIINAQLSDQPISLTGGIMTFEERGLPEASLLIEWPISTEGYRPGLSLESQMEIILREGEIDGGMACLRVSELRQYTTGQQEFVTLSEGCEQVILNLGSNDRHSFKIAFEPSGFTWVSQESPEGTYAPLEIYADALVTDHDVVIAETTKTIHLPPVEIINAGWKCNGSPATQSRAGETCVATAGLRVLADDPLAHNLLLSVQYTEEDLDAWGVSSLLFFIPCLAGVCKEEVKVQTQSYDLLLSAGEETTYSTQLELPLHPTGEVGAGGRFFLVLSLDGVMIWQGAELTSSSEP